MMFRFPSVICTRCTGFFCLAIIKGPPNDIYCIIEEPYKHYFTEKVSYSPYLRHGTLSFVSLLYVLSPEMAGQMVVQMRVPEINLAHGLQAQAANDLYRYF